MANVTPKELAAYIELMRAAKRQVVTLPESLDEAAQQLRADEDRGVRQLGRDLAAVARLMTEARNRLIAADVEWRRALRGEDDEY